MRLVQEHATNLLMQLHENGHLPRRRDDLDGVVGAAERQRRHPRGLAELAGVVFYRVVTRTPVCDDAPTFVGVRRLCGKALAAVRVGQPDAGDRGLFLRRGGEDQTERERQSREHAVRAHRANSVPSASTIDHMYISVRPIALGLPMHVTWSPTLMRSKSQPRRSSRLTLLNSMSQRVVVPSSLATRSCITECGFLISTSSISPFSAKSVT